MRICLFACVIAAATQQTIPTSIILCASGFVPTAAAAARPFIPNREKFRYATADEYAADVQPPQPPRVLDEDSAEAAEAMAAELNAAAAAEAAADDDDIGDDMAADAVTAGVAEQEAQPEQQQQQQGGSGCTGGCRRRLRSRGNGAAAVTADAVAAGAVKVNPSGTGGRPNGCLCWYTKELVVRKAGEGPHDLLKRLNWGYLPYESLKVRQEQGLVGVVRSDGLARGMQQQMSCLLFTGTDWQCHTRCSIDVEVPHVCDASKLHTRALCACVSRVCVR